ncbi:MAG TPA: hypothetical protein VMC85_03585 [Desulfomonilaceae bacterium]|nr:hypothetical protein [Desulfomonilaceae bacterium]
MKRLLALGLALLLVSASPAFAGFKGGGGSRSFRPSTPPKTLHQPAQPQTGTIKDLGVNPSSKSPADALKSRSTTTGPSPVASGAGAPQAAPASGFFGSSWFGSGWLNWAILGYLFGRHSSGSDEARIREREREREKEKAKLAEQAKEKEQAKAKEQSTDTQGLNAEESKAKERLTEPTRPVPPSDSRLGL